jgi:lysozyme
MKQMIRKMSDAGYQALKAREGLRLTAYRCQAGKLTIGWGHTDGVRPGQKITEAQACGLLAADVLPLERHLNKLQESDGVKLKQNEYDALISFIFNVGQKAFQISTMRKKLVAGRPAEEIAAEFDRWVYVTVTEKVTNEDGTIENVSKKIVSNGLQNRRKSEKAQYLSK